MGVVHSSLVHDRYDSDAADESHLSTRSQTSLGQKVSRGVSAVQLHWTRPIHVSTCLSIGRFTCPLASPLVDVARARRVSCRSDSLGITLALALTQTLVITHTLTLALL